MADEALTFDGLALHTAPYQLESFDPPFGKKQPEWLENPDADGAALGREPRYSNGEGQIRVRVDQQADMNTALLKIRDVVRKAQETSKQRDGLELVWTPAGSTRTLTFYVLSAEVEKPSRGQDEDSHLFSHRSPFVVVSLVAKPFGYGAEETIAGPTTSTDPLIVLPASGVKGDVPAEGRLIVTDNASQARRHVEWGLESRYYDAATSLVVDSDSMVTTGFAGTQATQAGAYDPNATGNNVIRATPIFKNPAQGIAVCGTGNLAHVGSYRVKARVYASSLDLRVRLRWQAADGPFAVNGYAAPPIVDRFCELDLGLVHIPEKRLGTQRWTGRIEAVSAASTQTGHTLDVDALWLIPVMEGYGFARATVANAAGVVVGVDEFAGTTAGSALSGRVAPQGGTWAEAGATGSFVFVDNAPFAGDETIRRTQTNDASPHFATLGATNYTDTEVTVDLLFSAKTTLEMGPVARYVDPSNYLRAYVIPQSTTDILVISAVGATGGGAVELPQLAVNTRYRLRLVAYSSGRAIATLLNTAGAVIATVEMNSSVLATGGALASGKPGIHDKSSESAASSRYYDVVTVAIPPPEPIVCHSGQSVEFRALGDDPALRKDATGTVYGRVPAYHGSRVWIPPAGDDNRSLRAAVKARRNDIDTAADSNIADSTTVELRARPRYVNVPYE